MSKNTIIDNSKNIKIGHFPKPAKKTVPLDCYPPKCHKTGMIHVPVGMLDISRKPDKPCTMHDCPYCIL